MNKAEFLNKLKQEISDLPCGEVEKTLMFYEESIDDRMEDGLTEENAVAVLGNPQKIANEIRADLPITRLIGNKLKESRDKSKNKNLWMILAVCGFPIWLPLSLAFAAMILAIYFVMWAVVVSLYAAIFSFGATAIGGIVFGVYVIFTNGLWQGLALLGLSVSCGGLFMITVKPMIWLTREIIKLTAVFMKKIKSKFVSKGEAI